MSFMGSLLGGMAGRVAVPVMGLAGVGAYKQGAFEGGLPFSAGSAATYYEASARVVSVEQVCRLRFSNNGEARLTQPMQCSRAVDALKNPTFRGYSVVPSTRTEYIYYGPDGSTLTSTLPTDKDAQGRPYHRGAVIRVRVDVHDPGNVEVI